MRLLPLIPIAVLTSAPALVLPTPGSAAVAAGAALLCAAGAILRQRFLVTAGASVTLVQYALALAATGSPPRPVSAAVLGTALALVLDTADFARRFDGVALTASARRRQLGHWAAVAGLGALSVFALAAAAQVVRIGAPPPFYPIAAAAGALAAAAGIAGTLKHRAGPPPVDEGR